MILRTLTLTVSSLAVAVVFALSALAQDAKPVQLPEPKLDPSKSLAQALKERKTTKEYATEDLPQQTLANLLWAAVGVNRPDSGKRTAPTAKNWQEIDVYVATTAGMYLYDPKGKALVPVVTGDIRSLTYTQVDRFKDAPVHVVYVADLAKTDGDEGRKMMMVAMDTGFAAENVYLYCATEGLNTAFRVSIDTEKLGQAMKLRPTQKIMAAQSIGRPKGK
jgi:hypothetical protein